MGGIEWSTADPEFELQDHDTGFPDPDIYGTSHRLVYTSGSAKEVESFHLALVQFDVGGNSRSNDNGEITTDFSVTYAFPPHRHTATRGRFISPAAPENDELQAVASGLVQAITKRQPILAGEPAVPATH